MFFQNVVRGYFTIYLSEIYNYLDRIKKEFVFIFEDKKANVKKKEKTTETDWQFSSRQEMTE